MPEEVKKVILAVDESLTFGRELLRGITQYSRLHGPWLIYSESHMSRAVVSAFDHWGADGMIAMTFNSRYEEKFISMRVPRILCIGSVEEQTTGLHPGLHYICGDNEAVGKMGAEYLLNRGFQHFALAGLSIDLTDTYMPAFTFGAVFGRLPSIC